MCILDQVIKAIKDIEKEIKENNVKMKPFKKALKDTITQNDSNLKLKNLLNYEMYVNENEILKNKLAVLEKGKRKLHG